MLSDVRVKELWNQARPFTGWEPWQTRYLELLEGLQRLPDEAFAQPENQARLWSADAVALLGPAGQVKVDGACSDPDVVHALLALRHRVWPEDPDERAQALHDARERLLTLVSPRHGARRPQARVDRLLAALLPADGHCVISHQARARIAALLLPEGCPPSPVLVRERLRRVLGPEQELGEHVRRSLFCHWLHEHLPAAKEFPKESLKESLKESPAESPAPHASPPPPRGPAPLRPWPSGKQFKERLVAEHPVETCRDLVQATLAGIARLDLLEAMSARESFLTFSLIARKAWVTRLKGLGLIEERQGLFWPTRDGEEFLEVDAPDILVHRMLERVLPLAALLRFLHPAPRRDEDFAPFQLTPEDLHANLAWLRALDLLETREGAHVLSAYGVAWEARLPRELPPLPAKGPPSPPPAVGAWPAWETIRQRFLEDARSRDLVLHESRLSALHLAWHRNPQKRFVTLSGATGMGKTALIQHYARLYCEALGLPPARHFEVVNISPEWRESANMLGFCHVRYEVPSFHVEPTLRFLLEASRNPSAPYFLLLEEMNVSRVDQYFAAFLTSMESGVPLTLHAQEEHINGVPPKLDWPRNLFIAGTVDLEDGASYTFSDKVLDRSFHLEFLTADLPAFFAKRPGPRHPDCEQIVQDFYDKLLPLRRHFGYRIAGELLSFVEGAGAQSSAEERRVLLDQALYSKVLPRVRGDSNSEIRSVLTAMRELCMQYSLKECGEKLRQMDAAFQKTGFTRF